MIRKALSRREAAISMRPSDLMSDELLSFCKGSLMMDEKTLTNQVRPGVVVNGPIVNGVSRVGRSCSVHRVQPPPWRPLHRYRARALGQRPEDWVAARLGNVDLTDLRNVIGICVSAV